MANIKAVELIENSGLFVVEYEKSVKYYTTIPKTVRDFIIKNSMSVKVRDTYIKWTKL